MPSSRFRTDEGMSFFKGRRDPIHVDCRRRRSRDVVDPYLHLDAIKVKTRDFRYFATG
jgi:hypothetical protein